MASRQSSLRGQDVVEVLKKVLHGILNYGKDQLCAT
jgi:hypothetical protein